MAIRSTISILNQYSTGYYRMSIVLLQINFAIYAPSDGLRSAASVARLTELIKKNLELLTTNVIKLSKYLKFLSSNSSVKYQFQGDQCLFFVFELDS